MAIDYFVPGPAPPGAGLLGGLLPPWPEGIARQFVEAYTHPDAIVLDPFAVSDLPVREVVAAGRRIIATNANPLVVSLLRERLSPPQPLALKAAATRLGDSLKRGVPLRDHLLQLYHTRCPACGHETAADYYIWSREPADPRQKWVACPACGQSGLAAVDDEDLAVLDQVETRGLHYWYLLNRVVPAATDEARPHVEKWMDLYTPRALYAIADVLMRIEATFDQETQVQLKTALLHVLGPASNLLRPDSRYVSDGSPIKLPLLPSLEGLQPPPRFLEFNLWRLFEAAVQHVAGYAAAAPPLLLRPDLHWVTRLPSSPEGLVWVHNLGTSALGRGMPPESLSLVLTMPPRPAPAFWSLSYLWTGWLFGSREAGRLKELALQKWPDWAWYQSVMSTALRALRPLFRFDGVCALILPGVPPQQAFAVSLAALMADYEVESWQYRAVEEHQLVLRPAPLHAPRPQEPETLRALVIAESARAALDALNARGEPMAAEWLGIAAWQRLLRKGVLETARASLPIGRVLGWLTTTVGKGLEAAQAGDLVAIEDDEGRPLGWWPSHVGPQAADPLGDRVEEALLSALREAGPTPVEEAALVEALYRRFNGPLTPDAGLVRACLEAYGEETQPGRWRLADGEQEGMGAERIRAAVSDLLLLGERLGYAARQGKGGFDVVWDEAGGTWVTFDVLLNAHVARFLASPPAPPEVRWRHLVVPAARRSLWEYKLTAQPWLAQSLRERGYTFVKLEHLHALAGREAITLSDLNAVIGLRPPVESGEGQLPLF